MDHRQTTTILLAQSLAAASNKPANPPATAPAPDMIRGYYLEKIQELEARLIKLNLMENAREISAICIEIIRAKKVLIRISLPTGFVA